MLSSIRKTYTNASREIELLSRCNHENIIKLEYFQTPEWDEVKNYVSQVLSEAGRRAKMLERQTRLRCRRMKQSALSSQTGQSSDQVTKFVNKRMKTFLDEKLQKIEKEEVNGKVNGTVNGEVNDKENDKENIQNSIKHSIKNTNKNMNKPPAEKHSTTCKTKISIITTFTPESFSLDKFQFQSTNQLPKTIKTIFEITKSILKGLNYLHNVANIVHRDIKPANIVVCLNPFLTVKIIDFGLARDLKEMNQGKHNIKSAGGSAYYLAPECIVDKECDNGTKVSDKIDVWGAGCCLKGR